MRKYRVALTLTNQHLEQLEASIRSSIFGNVGTLVAFRLGPEDARILVREFALDVEASDLVGLANFQVYIKLMIHGSPSTPFRARTIAPIGQNVRDP